MTYQWCTSSRPSPAAESGAADLGKLKAPAVELIFQIGPAHPGARGQLIGHRPREIVIAAGAPVPVARPRRWTALEVAGAVTLDRPDVVRAAYAVAAVDHHQAQIARGVVERAVAAEQAQHPLERIGQHDAPGWRKARRAAGAGRGNDGASGPFRRAPIW